MRLISAAAIVFVFALVFAIAGDSTGA